MGFWVGAKCPTYYPSSCRNNTLTQLPFTHNNKKTPELNLLLINTKSLNKLFQYFSFRGFLCHTFVNTCEDTCPCQGTSGKCGP